MVISPRILVKHEMSPRQKKKKSLVTLYLANMFTKTAEQVGTGGGLAPHFFQNRSRLTKIESFQPPYVNSALVTLPKQTPTTPLHLEQCYMFLVYAAKSNIFTLML